jgi:hypothetical protein
LNASVEMMYFNMHTVIINCDYDALFLCSCQLCIVKHHCCILYGCPFIRNISCSHASVVLRVVYQQSFVLIIFTEMELYCRFQGYNQGHMDIKRSNLLQESAKHSVNLCLFMFCDKFSLVIWYNLHFYFP